MDQSYEVQKSTNRGDFEIKFQDPILYSKMNNDNMLFVFAENSFNGDSSQEGIWIIPRSNREEYRKVSNVQKLLFQFLNRRIKNKNLYNFFSVHIGYGRPLKLRRNHT